MAFSRRARAPPACDTTSNTHAIARNGGTCGYAPQRTGLTRTRDARARSAPRKNYAGTGRKCANRRPGSRGLAQVAQERLHRTELRGLVEEIIRAAGPARELELRKRIIREHDDGRRRLRLERAGRGDDADPVARLEVQVDDDDVGMLGAKIPDRE